MDIEKTIKWGFVCGNCGHDVDSHGPVDCEQVLRTDYANGYSFMMPSKVTAREVCPCGALSLLRVKVKSVKKWD